MANRVVHFEIEAQDKERAKKFYSQAFGWEMQQMGQDFGDYVVVKTGEDTGKMEDMGINGGIYQLGEGKKEVNAYRCVIGVGDVNKAMADVKKAGGKVLSEKPDDIPNVGLFAKCEDTEGNVFTLLQPSPDMMPPQS
ncbi:MAG: VOC family protein [Patescibacteria group bacterium]|nr:VOC family protein [Patescibacteria group bacterium]